MMLHFYAPSPQIICNTRKPAHYIRSIPKTLMFPLSFYSLHGVGNSGMVSVFVCHAGHPGLRPAQSICFRKVECYQNVINFSSPVPTTGSPKAIHVLSCLCDNACKRSLAICRESRASCPVSRLLSVYIWPACAEQGR